MGSSKAISEGNVERKVGISSGASEMVARVEMDEGLLVVGADVVGLSVAS